MPRIEGEGLKDGRRYRAYQTMGEGLYRVIDEGADEPQPSDSVRVAIPRELVRKLATRRLPDETLSKQLQSIIEDFLEQGKVPLHAGQPDGGARTPKAARGAKPLEGRGGAAPHAWERPRRGGDRFPARCRRRRATVRPRRGWAARDIREIYNPPPCSRFRCHQAASP